MNNSKMSSGNIVFSERSSLSCMREKWVGNITIDDSTLVVVFRSYGCLYIRRTENRSRAKTILQQVCNLQFHNQHANDQTTQR